MQTRVKPNFVVVTLILIYLNRNTHRNKAVSRMYVCMYGQGLYPFIVRPSRITINSCTLIDNIFTNQINYSADSGLLITDISEHLPIFVLCKFELEKNKYKVFRNVRSLKEDNVLMFIESLKQEQWERVLSSDDVNIAYANVINTLNTLYNLHCPVKKVTKSTYFEDISMDVVAKVIPVISKHVTYICNIPFKTGVFPSRMKIAKIKPIFKCGAKTDIGNYRSIYILPQFSKMMEKLFLSRLDNFIKGYIKFKSIRFT